MEFKNILKIFQSHEYDKISTENKILSEIENILEKWPIDNIKTKDDFIRFIFKIYFYKLKYRPFISYLELIFRYYLIVLLLLLLWTSLVGWLVFYDESTFKFKDLWIMLSNIMYFSILLYIPLRIYSYIMKLLRHEIKSNFLIVFWFWFIKLFLFLLFIPFTWFIWNFFASLINIIYSVIIDALNILS